MVRLTILPLLTVIMAVHALADEPITPKTATKENPYVNSLGMKFVPVPITGGPTNGKLILFSIWDTRVQDYDAFLEETNRAHTNPTFEQGLTHPVVNVSWDDAVAFCEWLSKKEHMNYRLPGDHEWSCAVGIGKQEDADQLPVEKESGFEGIYPWGTQWPPPKGVGNYGENGLNNPFRHTYSVGNFEANQYGLFDMSGNVWQWCEDWYDKKKQMRVCVVQRTQIFKTTVSGQRIGSAHLRPLILLKSASAAL